MMKLRMLGKHLGIVVTFIAVMLLPSLVLACVWVNGIPFSPQEVREAERFIGGQIACGVYAFNPNTGDWWDFTRQQGGNIRSGQYQNPSGNFPTYGSPRPERRKSLSERGLLFNGGLDY